MPTLLDVIRSLDASAFDPETGMAVLPGGASVVTIHINGEPANVLLPYEEPQAPEMNRASGTHPSIPGARSKPASVELTEAYSRDLSDPPPPRAKSLADALAYAPAADIDLNLAGVLDGFRKHHPGGDLFADAEED